MLHRCIQKCWISKFGVIHPGDVVEFPDGLTPPRHFVLVEQETPDMGLPVEVPEMMPDTENAREFSRKRR